MSDYKPLYDKSYALVIGIDSYSDPRFPTLGNAASDAKSIADLLAGPPFNFNVTTLFNEAATRQGILTALFGLRSTGPDDRILIYFAGHGYTLVDKFNNETGYLAASDTIPEQDFTALELNEVTDLRLRAGAKHIAFVFDACFSGQALGLTRAASTASDKFLVRRAYQVISAGAGDQTVSDVRSMTTRLVEGLKGALSGVDGMVTFSQLGAYVRDTIATDSGQTQLPQFGQMRGSQGGDFVLYMDTGTRLPSDLMEAIYSKIDNIRLAAVVDLIDIVHGSDPTLAELARQRLETLTREDPSQEVRHAAASFFLRESNARGKPGDQRRVELVMQRRKPQALVNAFDALVPETVNNAPVPEEVKKAIADLDAAEAAKTAATEAEIADSAAQAAAAAPAPQAKAPALASAPPAAPLKAAASAAVPPRAAPAPGSAAGAPPARGGQIPIWVWGAGGVVVIGIIIAALTIGGGPLAAFAPAPSATAIPTVEATATTTPTTEPSPTAAPTDTPTAGTPSAVVPAVPPTATQFGGGRGTILLSAQRSGTLDIYSLSGIGGGAANLTNLPGLREETPTWAPDGAKFAFVSNRDGNKEIYVMNADGSDPINASASSADDYSPAWSHDGSRIAFVSTRAGNPDIYVMNSASFDTTRLTTGTFKNDHPTWSPDDSQIAFTSLHGVDNDLYIMNSNGRGLRDVTNNPNSDVDPAWSPDGKYIAFSSYRTKNWEIYLLNLSNLTVTQLTNNPSDDVDPSWSADSSRILFISNRQDDRQLWIMDLKGEHLQRVSTGFQLVLSAAWLN